LLKTAELLSLKGNTRGQRDELVTEILKVHTRFTARLGEYRFLLNMAEQFFNNLAQVTRRPPVVSSFSSLCFISTNVGYGSV